MWNSSAEPTSSPHQRLTAAAATLVGLLAFTTAALACDTREVAVGTATFNSCGTPWVWDSGLDTGDLYACDGVDCGPDTVLRVTRIDMSEEDRQFDREALLRDWEQRIVPGEMNGFRFEMAAPISIETIGSEKGVFIPLRVTSAEGDVYNSLAFRVPLDGFYLVVNATGATETEKLRGFLESAVSNMSIAEEHRK
jgi:hypothetical protein